MIIVFFSLVVAIITIIVGIITIGKRISNIKIRINSDIYKVEIKTIKKIPEYFNGYYIKLRGIIDKTQKVIKNPSEIWLKLE